MTALTTADAVRALRLNEEIDAFAPSPVMRDLVQQAQCGDATAFTLFCEHMLNPVFSYALIWSGAVQTAEIITEDTFKRALANILSFSRWAYSAEAWCMNIVRQVTTEQLGGEFTVDVRAFPPKDYSLMRMVAQLPTAHQECLLLRAGFGFDNSTVASIMGITPNLVTAYYYDASQAMRAFIKQ